MTRISLTLLALLAVFAWSEARAETTVNGLLEMYDAAPEDGRQFLEAVIDGNANGIAWTNSYLDNNRGPGHSLYCPPETMVHSGKALMAMLRDARDADPQYADMPYGVAVLFLMISLYPCP